MGIAGSGSGKELEEEGREILEGGPSRQEEQKEWRQGRRVTGLEKDERQTGHTKFGLCFTTSFVAGFRDRLDLGWRVIEDGEKLFFLFCKEDREEEGS